MACGGGRVERATDPGQGARVTGMRILHIVNRLSDRGNGIVNLAVDVAIDQQRAGHTVAFVAGQGGHVPLVEAAGIRVFSVDQDRTWNNLPLALVRTRKAIRSFRPDVIHAHMQTGLLLALPWARLHAIPLVGHLHNVHDRTARRMGWGDRLITVSAAVAESMRKEGVPAGKIRVVLNGTARSPRLPAVASLDPASLDRPSVLTVAGMSHRKGISELIEAFNLTAREFPDAHLYLMGEGPERELFEGQAAASPAKNQIHFLGFHATPQRFMLAADIFVLASRRDSCPLVLAEAREAGCAIVASDVDGIPEALDGGAAGILVPVQNPARLAEALLLLLRDPALRRTWAEKAQTGLDRFTVSRMSAEFVDIYRDLTDRQTGRRRRSGRNPATKDDRVSVSS